MSQLTPSRAPQGCHEKKATASIEAVAHHEAGHVAAMYSLGYLDDLESVTVVPGERDKGSTVVHIDSLLMPEDRYDRWPQFGEHKLRRILTHSILFWLAGRAAEARFLGIDVGNVSECGADLSEVRDHILSLCRCGGG
jgi:hypothetical protein